MDSYIEVLNDNNILQVNDCYENLSFLKKINIREWERVDNLTWKGTLSIEENPAFWFIYNNSDYEVKMIFFAANVQGRYGRYICITLNEPSVSPDFLEFYVFGFKSNLHRANYGLELFNRNGRCIFSSEGRYLKIIETLIPEELDTDYIWKPANGKKIAVHPTGIPVRVHPQPQTGHSLFTWKKLVLGPYNSYIKAPRETELGIYYSGSNPDFSPNIAYKSMWTIADITGL